MKSESTGAKLNLSLAVTGKRGNMHTLDMRVCTADVCDRAELLPGEGERFVFRSFPEGFVPERFVPRLNAVYGKLRARFGGDLRFLTLDAGRKLFEQLILQPVLLALVVGFENFQLCYLHIQIHLFLDERVARAQRLDLGVAEDLLVHVLAGSNRRF